MAVLVEILRWACGFFALVLLAFILWSILRGVRRPVGTTVGRHQGWLHSPLFYVAASTFFIGTCILIWFPLPGTPFPDAIAVLGALVCFPGLTFVLWGRLALATMYFVSTGFGAQLFAGHRLITNGPYAIVRHPMYSGIFVGMIGSLPLYQTWSTVFLIFIGLVIVRRALVEEEVLAMMFGPEWMEYSRRVPMFIPWIRRRDDRPPASPAG